MGDLRSSGDASGAKPCAPSSTAEPCNIKTVVFGEDLEFDAWYGCSFYSPENDKKRSSEQIVEKLYVCSRCFKYSLEGAEMGQHLLSCSASFKMPGKLVYQYNQFSIREIDGETDKLYCQCLCMFTKLFLDTKSICFAVEKFKFYVLIHHVSSKSEQAVGFFSKENLSWDENNLACILIFPPFQSQGLGQMLIEFSYQLSTLDGKLGSPEKPLSEYGRKSYLLYWCTAIYRALPYFEKEKSGNVSINDISMATGIKQEDVVDALKSMDALQKRNTEDSNEKLHWVISKTNIENWALKRKVKMRPLIDPNYVLIS